MWNRAKGSGYLRNPGGKAHVLYESSCWLCYIYLRHTSISSLFTAQRTCPLSCSLRNEICRAWTRGAQDISSLVRRGISLKQDQTISVKWLPEIDSKQQTTCTFQGQSLWSFISLLWIRTSRNDLRIFLCFLLIQTPGDSVANLDPSEKGSAWFWD